MILSSGDMEPKEVHDYDIVFTNGVALPLTIDESAGDHIHLGDKDILVHISPKPSQGDPTTLTPAEEITINRSNVIIINHRIRQVIPQSPEQKDQLQKLLKLKAGKAVH